MKISDAKQLMFDEMVRKQPTATKHKSQCVPKEIASEMIMFLTLESLEEEGKTELSLLAT